MAHTQTDHLQTDVRPTVAGLYRYPVKGLSAERLEQVRLDKGGGVPFDRAYAVENGPTPFDPQNPQWLSKTHFVVLMRYEQLAELHSTFDEADRTVRLVKDGAGIASGDLECEEGRAAIADAIGATVASGLRGAPRVVSSPGHSFTDVAAKCLHIINLESVRALEREMGIAIDPLRFRPNVIVEGLPAWSELKLVGSRLEVGETVLDVFKRTERCAATNVNPETARRDAQIPSFLSRRYGHTDFGVYARVVRGGVLMRGDAVTISQDCPS